MLFGRHIITSSLKLQAKIDRWIDKCCDRAEGNIQFRRNLIEAQADRKAMIGHFQFPELVLQNNRHLVREAFA